MQRRRYTKPAARVIALLLAGHLLLFYPLPLEVLGIVLLVFGAICVSADWRNALLASVSFAVSTLFLVIFVRASGVSDRIYYRPHEMFGVQDSSVGQGRYQTNVRFEMAMPHGDLKATALRAKVDPEPRSVVFHTDSLGYRNSADYRGQAHLLVGDSFVVGNGTTQPSILSEQLHRDYGIDTYNLAHVGGIRDYASYIRSFRDLFETKSTIILFLFEGNDFPLPRERERYGAIGAGGALYSAIVETYRGYRRFFARTEMYRFLYSVSRRALATRERVDIEKIQGVPVAFIEIISV